MPLPTKTYAAFLFDMDGTLISSIAATNRAWTRWAKSHGLDPVAVLRTMHGVRAIEVIRRLNVPGMDVEYEAAVLTQAEMDDAEGVVPIKGALELLQDLPPERWAIATSAPRELAVIRLAAAGIPQPRALITADDVTQGKPAPDCFAMAARQLDVPVCECLVWEDSLAGVQAAVAAGSDVMVISATHEKRLETLHPMIVDYERVGVMVDDSGRLALTQRPAV
jgi:mannitol-1-/sugar-/sorbitol-6-phosphatase